MITIDGKKAYNTTEVAAITGHTPKYIRNVISAGKLKGEKVNGCFIIYADDLVEYQRKKERCNK